MKLFKTKNGLQDHTKVVVFEPSGDKTILKQYTARGYFVDTLDVKVETKFAVDKISFLKAVGILKDPTFEETKTTLILRAGGKEINLPKVENEVALNVKSTPLENIEFKELPNGLFEAIKEVAEFIDPNNQNLILQGVKINKLGVSGGTNTKASFIKLPSEIDEIVMPIASLSSVEKLTHFALSDVGIWFANEDKTQVAKLTLIDGNVPQFERLFEAKNEGAKNIDFDYNELHEAVKNALSIGSTYVTIKDNLLTSNVGYSHKITLNLGGLKGSYVASDLMLGLLDGKLKISKEDVNFVVIFEKDNQQTITTAYRAVEED